MQVLQAWFLYKEESLRKKQRLAAAAETRRARLVREGASQWLRVAGALAESRANLATQQQVQVTASELIASLEILCWRQPSLLFEDSVCTLGGWERWMGVLGRTRMRQPLRLDWSEFRVGAVATFAGMAFHILKWCWEEKPLSEHSAAEGEVMVVGGGDCQVLLFRQLHDGLWLVVVHIYVDLPVCEGLGSVLLLTVVCAAWSASLVNSETGVSYNCF